MNPRRAGWVIWPVAIVGLASVPLGILLEILASDGGTQELPTIGFSVGTIGFLAAGVLIATRRPANPIGWLFMVAGSIGGLSGFAASYATYAGSQPNPMFGGAVLEWLGDVTFIVPFALLIVLFLIFPHGRVLSRRWRLVAWLVAIGTGLILVGGTIAPTLYDSSTPNPLGLSAPEGLAQAIGSVGFLLLFVSSFAGVASMILRLRRSRSLERQQMKWFTLATALTVALFLPAVIGGENGPVILVALLGLAFAVLPISVAVAILRHRLYDIDRIINKALVYGLLTALLGGAYAGVVFGIGGLVSDNSVVVAVATLIVAALFRPARARVQGLIDRRFYRRRYDAARTLEAFGARLREEVDLDQLNGDLLGVVRETLQPARASLWLRGVRAQ